MIPDPLALALRTLRGSPNTEAAGHRDAAEADTLHRVARNLGWALLPIELDADMRLAIWRTQAVRLIQTPSARDAFIAERLRNAHQAESDRALWAAAHAAAARRLGRG